MCKFENDFLLCTCSDSIAEKHIGWMLKKRTKLKPSRAGRIIIGQSRIPEEFKDMPQEEYYKMLNEKVEEMLRDSKEMLSKLREVSPVELKNILINIQFDLNNRNCFDKEMTFAENDVLSIRIGTKELVWADFIYKNSFWKILEVDRYEYKQIQKGPMKILS